MTKEDIAELEKRLLPTSVVEMPVTHRFAPGVYIREIFMPKGTFVIGHEHKTKHFNILLEGEVIVSCDGKETTLKAPLTFVSEAGVRKVLVIVEDTKWATVHPTDETDVQKLEELLVYKTEAYLDFNKKKELSL